MDLMYSTDSEALGKISNLVKRETFAIHHHNFYGRERQQKMSLPIDPRQPLFKMMELLCPVTSQNLLHPNIGNQWFEMERSF